MSEAVLSRLRTRHTVLSECVGDVRAKLLGLCRDSAHHHLDQLSAGAAVWTDTRTDPLGYAGGTHWFPPASEAEMQTQLRAGHIGAVPETVLAAKCTAKRLESVRARFALSTVVPQDSTLPLLQQCRLSVAHEADAAVVVTLPHGVPQGDTAFGVDLVAMQRVRAMFADSSRRGALAKRARLLPGVGGGGDGGSGCGVPDTPEALAACWGVKEALAKALTRNALYSSPTEVTVAAPEDLLTKGSTLGVAGRALGDWRALSGGGGGGGGGEEGTKDGGGSTPCGYAAASLTHDAEHLVVLLVLSAV